MILWGLPKSEVAEFGLEIANLVIFVLKRY
jgi:hypothetical protein